MLLPDEKVIMYWLSQYGVMIQEQALLLLYDKPRPTAQKIIRGLIKNNRICYINGGYYIGASPLCKPDEKTITAIWVLLRYISKIGICDHHSANYPGQIYFLKDQTGYEIIVLNEGEYMLPSLLTPQEQLKYIIVVPREDDIPRVRIPDCPCMFATVGYHGKNVPEVNFYLPGG